MRKSIGNGIINLARKLFAGSFVQRWKITTYIYMWVFDAMYGKRDTETQFRGARFVVPTKDISLAPSVMAGNFERHELDFFERACVEGDTVIDIGANIGLYSVIAAIKVGKHGAVYAFEPVPENIEFLRKNLHLNKVSNVVHIEQSAVGEKNGKLDIYLSDRQVGTHSAAQKIAGAVSIQVPMRSVDAFITQKKIKKINVMKVDVEGYDGQVLQGALKALRRHKPVLFIEYSPHLLQACGQDPQQFIESLSEIYQNCILVDEFKDRVASVDVSEIFKLKIVTNVNLIFAQDISAFRPLLNA